MTTNEWSKVFVSKQISIKKVIKTGFGENRSIVATDGPSDKSRLLVKLIGFENELIIPMDSEGSQRWKKNVALFFIWRENFISSMDQSNLAKLDFVVFSDPSNFKALHLFNRVRLKLHQAFFCFDMIILVWKFSWFSHGRFWEASLIKLHSCSWISSFRITMIRSWMRPRISTISRRLNS